MIASDFYSDNSTVNGLKQLPSRLLKRGVVIRANGPIMLGNTDCANTGFALAAGEQSPLIEIDNLSKLWVASTGEQGYSWVAM